jgi:hypothetical protein
LRAYFFQAERSGLRLLQNLPFVITAVFRATFLQAYVQAEFHLLGC